MILSGCILGWVVEMDEMGVILGIIQLWIVGHVFGNLGGRNGTIVLNHIIGLENGVRLDKWM